jgi:hypothetical protein
MAPGGTEGAGKKKKSLLEEMLEQMRATMESVKQSMNPNPAK